MKWIPVKEKLPEEGKYVLITTDVDSYDMELNHKKYVGVTIGVYTESMWLIENETIRIADDDVTAWMPLPEPYKEEI